jgi:hypothetical protein
MNWSSIFTPTVLKVLFVMYLILLPTCLTWIVIAFEFEPSEYVIRELLLLAAVMIGIFYIYTIYKWVNKRNELYTRGGLGMKGTLGKRSTPPPLEQKLVDTEGDEFGITTQHITAEQAEFYKENYFNPWKSKINKAVITIFRGGRKILNDARSITARLNTDKLNVNDRDNVTKVFKTAGATCTVPNVLDLSLENLNTHKAKIITCIEDNIIKKINGVSKGDIKRAIRKYLRASFKRFVISKYGDKNSTGSEDDIYEEIDKWVDDSTLEDKEQFLEEVFDKLDEIIGNIDRMSVFTVHDLKNLNDFNDILKKEIPSK